MYYTSSKIFGNNDGAIHTNLCVPSKGDVDICFWFIHGGGESSSERTQYLSCKLAENNKSSVSIDFLGHGKSVRTSGEDSLFSRTEQFITVFNAISPYFKDNYLVGSSMGADIAIRLTDIVEAKGIVLFCPAAYPDNCFYQNFGNPFRQCISRKWHLHETTTIEKLKSFKGGCVLVYGTDDSVIPNNIRNYFITCAKERNNSCIIQLKDCPHQIHKWLPSHNVLADEVARAILNLC